jgi:hypothetical protein
VRRVLAEWVPYYNRPRPHASLGPGIPEPAADAVVASNGHQIGEGQRIASGQCWAACITTIV